MKHKTPFFTNRRILLLSVLLLCLLLLIIAFDSRLLIRTYTLDADEITSPVRIVLVSDLHSCRYGKNQCELIEAVTAQAPDLVLLTGDIFDDVRDNTDTELFLAGIADKFPCYYVTGNHECWGGRYRFDVQMGILEKYNIPVLSGTAETLSVRGETIRLCGVDDPDVYMVNTDLKTDPAGYSRAQADKEETFLGQIASVSASAKEGYTILLSHRPEYFAVYTQYAFDLVLCGHAHGGQWRIPGILNGLYAPHQGIFPEYAGGRYDANGTTMLVSRGLARETTRVPRIFNRPELVVVEIR